MSKKALIHLIRGKSRLAMYTLVPQVGRRTRLALVLRTALLILSFFMLSACGLDVVPFLYPPESPSSISDRVQFVHDTRNNDTPQSDFFRGYEVYYKFYDFGADGANQLQNDRDAIEADPVPPGPSRLTTRNFRRLRSLDNNNQLETRLPLIPVSTGSSPSIQVRFSGVADTPGAFVFFNNNPATAIPLVRAVDDDGAQPRRFYGVTEYESTHADVPNTIDVQTNGADLQIAFYAVAYGVQPDFRPLYSTPRFLANEISLSFE